MQELDDNALLREYVERNSGEAFAVLVERHINKVYSVALRRLGNPHQAEEITQAVFIILARKSPRLGRNVILSGWLYQTARLTTLTFIRGEIRRARREQEACMQTIGSENENDVWKQIAPLLEDAMAALNETDRHAIVLRFFDGKSMREVGAALGSNESAAKMRIGRAVEKLQHFFSRHGVTSKGEAITGAISAHSVQAAPAALAKTVAAVAIAKGTIASISTLALVKTTLIAMTTKIKITIASAMVLAVILGAGVYLATRTVLAPQILPTSVTLPLKFPDAAFKPAGDKNGRFVVDVDPDARRTSDSSPAIHIKGPVDAAPGTATPFIPSNNRADWGANNTSISAYRVAKGSPLLGQRIKVTAWLKTINVQKDATAYVSIWADDRGWCRVDSMDDRGISGTDWQQIEIITDVPDEPCVLVFGADLHGPGELWADDFQIALADPGEPVTDDTNWRQTCASPHTYSGTLDSVNRHDGNPTLCLAHIGNGAAPRGSWTWWGQMIRLPECQKYLSHTIRMTGWVKTQDVSGRLQPAIRPWVWMPSTMRTKLLATDSMSKDYSLKGTLDWTQFSVTCDIPKETQHIETCLIFWGSGKVWIDTNSITLDIVK
jgi:RNA polymerase sigma factor (sigma-70 family)